MKVQHQHEAIREKNKLAYLKEYKKAKEITNTVNQDLEFLDKVDGQFDPFEAAVTGATSHLQLKRKKVA